MLKITKESFRLGLIFSLSIVLFSELWDGLLFVAFPNQPRAVSSLARYVVNPPDALGAVDIFFLFFFPVFILILAGIVSKLIDWLGEETHVGFGAGWRWGALGFSLSFLEFSEMIPSVRYFVWVLFFLAYWLLFHKFGLKQASVAA